MRWLTGNKPAVHRQCFKNMSTQSHHKVLTKKSINPAIIAAKYAVRGELAIKSDEFREELRKDEHAKVRLGFDKVISANIGNPQQLGQKGLTFLRQVSLSPIR